MAIGLRVLCWTTVKSFRDVVFFRQPVGSKQCGCAKFSAGSWALLQAGFSPPEFSRTSNAGGFDSGLKTYLTADDGKTIISQVGFRISIVVMPAKNADNFDSSRSHDDFDKTPVFDY